MKQIGNHICALRLETWHGWLFFKVPLKDQAQIIGRCTAHGTREQSRANSRWTWTSSGGPPANSPPVPLRRRLLLLQVPLDPEERHTLLQHQRVKGPAGGLAGGSRPASPTLDQPRYPPRRRLGWCQHAGPSPPKGDRVEPNDHAPRPPPEAQVRYPRPAPRP